MQQVVGEMKNLSIAQPSGRAEATTTSVPVYDISSVPTTAGANLNVFDSNSLSTMHSTQGRQDIVPPVTISSAHLSSVVPPQLFSSNIGGLPQSTVPSLSQATMASLPLGGQLEVDRYQQLGAVPRSRVNPMPTISGWGANLQTNIVSACSTMPVVGIPSTHSGFPSNSVRSIPLPTSMVGLETSCGVTNSGHIPQQMGNAANVGLNGGFMFGQTAVPRIPQLNDPVGQFQIVPTQHQLMARQVMPKDLPLFRGDPEDWPLFNSAYVNSTAACGYSDVARQSF